MKSLPRSVLAKLPPGRGVNPAAIPAGVGVNFAAFGLPATEAEFQRQVIAFARGAGWDVFSVPDSRRATCGGFQDLTFKRDAGMPRAVVAELKMPGEKPRPDQVAWLAAWEAMGVPTFVWTPADMDQIRRVLA